MAKTLSGLILLGLALSVGTAQAQRTEENGQAVSLNGTWTAQSDSRASGGGYTVSNTPGNTVTFAFTGDSVTMYRRVDTDGGAATVAVDGTVLGTFSFYFQEQRWQVPTVVDHLGPGQHTLVLTVSGQEPPGSTGLNVYIDAFESPAPFTPSAAQEAARDRVNQYRTPAGLPAVRLSTAIDLAAQAHADYNAKAGILAHTETPGADGFVGATFADRMTYFGYDGGRFEVAAEAGNPKGAVDEWMGTVYHRLPFMIFGFSDIGYGLGLLNGAGMDVMDFGSKGASQPPVRAATPYPRDGQQDVPLAFQEESPDPLPGKPRPVGFAISVHIAQPASPPNGTPGPAAANSGTLADGAGQPVAVYFLDRSTDPNGFLNDAYYIVPQQPLKVSTLYHAHITGTDTQGVPFDTQWSFTTVPASAIVSVIPFGATPNSIWIQWNTADVVTGTFLQYGTTTAYGTTVAGIPNNGADPTSMVAQLTGLTAGTTYHYQIAATDALGNTRTTDDATFVTPAQ